MRHPTLYKLSSSGKLMQWGISVYDHDKGGQIHTSYGYVDGTIQTTIDIVSEGKNLGKKNATTALEQAAAETEARWTKQQRIKGYSDSKEKALAGDSIRGEFDPMLAKSFDKDKAKVVYPAAIQPKLDGMRCGALIDWDDGALQSRAGKPITAVPHILEQLQQAFRTSSGRIDGELYNHALRSDFEKLISIVRKASGVDEEKVMEYHIYDMIEEGQSFEDRSAYLRKILVNPDGSPVFSHLRFVETRIVNSEEEALEATADFTAQGYEGGMVRNLASEYEVGKRSQHLQKIKKFVDEEFEIVGITEGRGKLMGHAATFVCKTKDGQEFGAKLKGATERLKEYFDDHSLWKGKQATVCYQNLTKDGIPRFPVAKAIRDYE